MNCTCRLAGMGLGAGCPGANCANKKSADELVGLLKNIALAPFQEAEEPIEEAEEPIEFEWHSTPALWAAYRHGYDGAPDAHCKVGYGKTKELAAADLIEQEQG